MFSGNSGIYTPLPVWRDSKDTLLSFTEAVMLAHLKMSGKLFVGFGVVLALLAIVSLFNISNSNKINQQVDQVKEIRYRDAIETISAINRAEKILSSVVYASEAATLVPLEDAEQEKVALEKSFAQLGKTLPASSSAAQKFASFRGLFERCFEIGMKMTGYSVNQELIEFVGAREEYTAAFTQLEDVAAKLKTLVSEALYSSLEEINHLSERTVRWSSYLTVVGLILGIGLSTIIARNMTRPMHRVVEVIGDIGNGNLAQRLGIQRGDEIGQVAAAMDDMSDKLGQMVQRIRVATEEFSGISGAVSDAAGSVKNSAQLQEEGVANTSAAIIEIGASIDSVAKNVESLNVSAADSTSSTLEMAATIEEVAENAQRLAQAVDEISSAIDQMASAISQVAGNAEVLKKTSDATASTVAEMDVTIKQVEEHARETAKSTAEVLQDAQHGQSSVEKTIAGIRQIKSSSHVTSTAVENLAEKVKDIGSILAVIDEITEQTNLLALNAAIISAQAGQHGKGFAVVADEIRELSQRTSQSTRKIEAVIEDVQQETGRAVAAIRETETIVAEGEGLSLQSGEMLEKIVGGAQGSSDRVDHIVRTTIEQAQASRLMRESVESVSDMVVQIASATRQQDQGARSITSASELISGLTQQVKNSTREQSQTSHTIGAAMEQMTELVQQVKVACDQQNVGSDNIVKEMEGIKETTSENVGSVEALNGAVARLGDEITVLQEEMAVFKVEETG